MSTVQESNGRADHRVSSLDKPNSDVTSPEIRFCLAPVGKKTWFSSASLFDPCRCRQENLVSPLLVWARGKECDSDVRDSAGRMEPSPQNRLGKFP